MTEKKPTKHFEEALPFETPEIQIIYCCDTDVITTSDIGKDNDPNMGEWDSLL